MVDNGVRTVIEFCEERFRISIGAVNFARVTYEIPQSDVFPMIYEYLNEDYIARNRPILEESTMPLFDLYNKKHAEKVISEMMYPLRDNVKAI